MINNENKRLLYHWISPIVMFGIYVTIKTFMSKNTCDYHTLKTIEFPKQTPLPLDKNHFILQHTVEVYVTTEVDVKVVPVSA